MLFGYQHQTLSCAEKESFINYVLKYKALNIGLSLILQRELHILPFITSTVYAPIIIFRARSRHSHYLASRVLEQASDSRL